MRERVLVAMSGGVDSSVAAARLVEQGHDVVGVTLHLWDYPDDGSVRGRCCAPEDLFDARRVADRLGIPHYTFDRRELFQREVVTPFVDAYLGGETPSPCVSCNRSVKLRELLALADDLGARTVATGHYARVDTTRDPPELLRAVDRSKDQSYFLHMLQPAELARVIFPLGASTKAEVRASALALGLPGAGKGESQELCFVPQGRYDQFVAERANGRLAPGSIVNEAGTELGQHSGIHRFTIGQRRHLGVAVGERAYVVDIDAGSQRVTLGTRERLLAHGARLDQVSLMPDVRVPFSSDAVVRYRGQPVGVRVTRLDSGALEAAFTSPVHAVVPGQVMVFYTGERVLGGGRISEALKVASHPEPARRGPPSHEAPPEALT
jgi:tRNA-specific 2-thiouridylase